MEFKFEYKLDVQFCHEYVSSFKIVLKTSCRPIGGGGGGGGGPTNILKNFFFKRNHPGGGGGGGE